MRLPILGGSYTSKSVIASAQRAVNLYPETNPERAQASANTTHYPRPGRTPLGAPPAVGHGRMLYTATNGDLYAGIDQRIYYVNPDWNFTLLGSTITPGTNPMYMADNGQNGMIVDGSASGYNIALKTRTMTQIGDPNFLGADRVDFIDSFLVMNQSGTPNWYSTLSNQIAFNALDFGSKTAWPDPIQSLLTIERQVLLLGAYKGELWTNAGTSPFAFQIIPGNIIEYGIAAKYSLAKQDIAAFWVSQSPEGNRIAVRLTQAGAARISTYAIEAEWRTYPTVADGIGSCYQIEGHSFYKIDFPTAGKTWVFDLSTEQWHEQGYLDVNGVLRRMRDSFCAFAYDTNVCLDYATGQLYKIDPQNFTDNGNPILCLRGLPHVIDQDKYERVTFWRCMADIEVGTATGTVNVPTVQTPWSLGFSPGFGPRTLTEPPLMSLRISHTRGESYTDAQMQPMGAAGLYRTVPTWNRLGYGRDIVLELSWSTPMKTALQGVWLDVEPSDE